MLLCGTQARVLSYYSVLIGRRFSTIPISYLPQSEGADYSMRSPTVLPPSRVCDLASAVCPDGASPNEAPWACILKQRADWGASLGTWIATQSDLVTCVAHFVPRDVDDEAPGTSKWGVQVWVVPSEFTPTAPAGFQAGTEEIVGSTIKRTKQEILDLLAPNTKTVTMTVASVQRELTPLIAEALQFRTQFVENADLYTLSRENEFTATDPAQLLSDGFRFRNLTGADAELVDSTWEYRSASSLDMVRDIIESDETLSYGVENSKGDLCAWILQYRDGALGLLFCLEEHRKRGLARALVRHATDTLFARGNQWVSCFIIESNVGSRNLFKSLGWAWVCHADWAGFTSERSND